MYRSLINSIPCSCSFPYGFFQQFLVSQGGCMHQELVTVSLHQYPYTSHNWLPIPEVNVIQAAKITVHSTTCSTLPTIICYHDVKIIGLEKMKYRLVRILDTITCGQDFHTSMHLNTCIVQVYMHKQTLIHVHCTVKTRKRGKSP